MKRVVSLVLVFISVLVAICLTGCGDKRQVIYVLTTKPEYTDYYNWLNEEFEKEYPLVRVEITNATTGDFNSAFTARVQGGKLDVFTMSTHAMLQGMHQYMADISDLNFWNKYDDSFRKQGGLYDDKQNKVIQLSAMLDYVGAVVYYNKDMFSQYGWEIPTTYSGFLSLCQTIKDMSNNAVGMVGKTKIAKNAPILMGGKDQWPIFTLEGQI